MIETTLRSLSLSGYRSYNNDLDQNKIELKDVNIIIGANGADKSNLISFLEMVSYMMTRGLRNYVAKQGGAKSLLHYGLTHESQIRGGDCVSTMLKAKKKTYICSALSKQLLTSFFWIRNTCLTRPVDISSHTSETLAVVIRKLRLLILGSQPNVPFGTI